MTANFCEKLYLGDPQIFETFSVCSLRDGEGTGSDRNLLAMEKCCTNTIKDYQCWYYCQVEESAFPTWLDCVHGTLNSTWGTACQRADQSPVLTHTGPYPASYEEPPPPLDYTYPPELLSKRAEVTASTTSSTISLLITGVSSAATSTPIATASPTSVPKSGSSKVLGLSIGGVMCAILVLSTLAL